MIQETLLDAYFLASHQYVQTICIHTVLNTWCTYGSEHSYQYRYLSTDMLVLQHAMNVDMSSLRKQSDSYKWIMHNDAYMIPASPTDVFLTCIPCPPFFSRIQSAHWKGNALNLFVHSDSFSSCHKDVKLFQDRRSFALVGCCNFQRQNAGSLQEIKVRQLRISLNPASSK